MQSNEASIASALKFVQCGLPCRKREMRVTSKDAENNAYGGELSFKACYSGSAPEFALMLVSYSPLAQLII